MKRLLNEINSEEYQDHQKWLDKEQALIRKVMTEYNGKKLILQQLYQHHVSPHFRAPKFGKRSNESTHTFCYLP